MEIFLLEGEFEVEKIQKWSEKLVLFNPDLVLNEKHVFFALWHARKAFENGTNIARDFQLEFLVRLSGKRQIKKAMDYLPKKRIGACLLEGKAKDFCAETGLHIIGDVLQPPGEAFKKAFGVRGDEKDLEKKIFERTAMTDV